MTKHGLYWIGKTWTRLIKYGLVKDELVKHRLIKQLVFQGSPMTVGSETVKPYFVREKGTERVRACSFSSLGV